MNEQLSGALVDVIKAGKDGVVNIALFAQQQAPDLARQAIAWGLWSNLFEVFIELFKSINSFKEESKLSTWIYRIAVTKSLDEIKKRNRKKRITSVGKILHIDDVMHWIGGGSMPDKIINEKEKMQEIRVALNTLPDNQRVAFTLSKMEGYSNPEIAEIMDTTVMAVESLIYRAKKKLSDELKAILKNN